MTNLGIASPERCRCRRFGGDSHFPRFNGPSYLSGLGFRLIFLCFVYIKMALALRFQALARRSSIASGSNVLRRMPLRSYSSSASVDGTLPLEGIRVLDMTRVLAGVSSCLLISCYLNSI